MKFTKYERQAAEGKPLPNDLGLVDACMYEALRYLYASHRIGIIERDAAAKEKERLVNLYLAFRAYSFTASKSLRESATSRKTSRACKLRSISQSSLSLK